MCLVLPRLMRVTFGDDYGKIFDSLVGELVRAMRMWMWRMCRIDCESDVTAMAGLAIHYNQVELGRVD